MRETFSSTFQVLQNDDDDDDVVEWGVKMINENSSITAMYTAFYRDGWKTKIKNEPYLEYDYTRMPTHIIVNTANGHVAKISTP